MHTCPASSLDLFCDSIRLMGDATLCAVMVFGHELDTASLREAARACMLAHPILHSRLVRGAVPAYWKMADPSTLDPFRPETRTGSLHRQVIGPVDPYSPLQFRVRLLRTHEGDTIVINLAHAAADAFGLQALASQLLREYEAPGSIRPAPGGIPARDTLWTRGLHGGGAPATSEMRLIDPMWPDPFGTSQGPPSFHREIIEPQAIDAVRAHARSYGGNVNDVLLAAYFLAMSDLTDRRGPMNLYFPVNLRQHLTDGSRVMSNQATNVGFPLDRRNGEGMEGILPRVIEATKQLKGQRIGIAEQTGMDEACDPEGRNIHRMVEAMAAIQALGMADIFISNPGVFDLPAIRGLEDAWICYPGGFLPTTCFVTSTFRNRMTITMGYQDSDPATAGTRKALDLFTAHVLSVMDDRGKCPGSRQ